MYLRSCLWLILLLEAAASSSRRGKTLKARIGGTRRRAHPWWKRYWFPLSCPPGWPHALPQDSALQQQSRPATLLKQPKSLVRCLLMLGKSRPETTRNPSHQPPPFPYAIKPRGWRPLLSWLQHPLSGTQLYSNWITRWDCPCSHASRSPFVKKDVIFPCICNLKRLTVFEGVCVEQHFRGFYQKNLNKFWAEGNSQQKTLQTNLHVIS